MTYWFYDPKKLASSSTLIPYKQKNLDEYLNFLSFLCLLLYVYLYKTKQLEKYGKALLFFFLTVLFLGIAKGGKSKTNYINNDNNNFGNYDNSLLFN